jgi:hypothetical protein
MDVGCLPERGMNVAWLCHLFPTSTSVTGLLAFSDDRQRRACAPVNGLGT